MFEAVIAPVAFGVIMLVVVIVAVVARMRRSAGRATDAPGRDDDERHRRSA
jgi:uncharacterized membrane protein